MLPQFTTISCTVESGSFSSDGRLTDCKAVSIMPTLQTLQDIGV